MCAFVTGHNLRKTVSGGAAWEALMHNVDALSLPRIWIDF